uniref:Hesp-327 n=1 Tax=Melampsora lini TaxID=5261 RepID=Q2MV40_MELLI|nr:hesp-327 [Melampsora lini]
MCSSLPIVLSMLLIGAISSTTADISNQPNSQTLQGPPGTKLVHTFVMKGATVSFYQKTTVVTTQSTTTRARERRQVSND